ncbi:MAG: CRISPR system precrRNA processing endoribonuclease RAMP protein Cas6 [Candidatus Brocadia sinica]|nr:CRISPR system precrRNA processing endoribonuclease RAMP protein Cas6 [Candidatus Brocadia sinica]NUO05242.1 CRISPR system precrRNA processing endoribonuclease RAMP protein Cas6 [Candidatus Brocadia sinica]
MLKTFRMAKFRFTICAKDHIRFPAYKGSAFRGGFGYAFKRVVCVIKGKACDECLLKQKCIYSYIFETPPPEDTEMLRLYPKVPHPFVIEPPNTEKQSFEPGEEFAFHVILIGQAIDYLPYFIYTFTELGKQGIGQGRGKYDLIQVEGIGLGNEAVPIYQNTTQTLTNHYPIIHAHQMGINSQDTHNEVISQSNPPYQGGHQFNSPYRSTERSRRSQEETKGGVNAPQQDCSQENNHNNTITISLLTPLRLRFDGHITDKIEFHVLIRNLLRRISSLSYFHCGEKVEIDFKGLIEKARAVRQGASDIHWFDWKRYSTRQEEWMSLGGVTGTVSYEGDLSEFMLFLRLGEYVHVGKGTSFGLGRYSITV